MEVQTRDFAKNGTPHIGLVYERSGWKWHSGNFLSGHKSSEKYEVTVAISVFTMAGIGTPSNVGGFTEFEEFGKINTIYLAYGPRSTTSTKWIIEFAKRLAKKTGAKVHWSSGSESGCEDASN